MRSTSVRELLLHLAVTDLVNINDESFKTLSLDTGRVTVVRGSERIAIHSAEIGSYEYDYEEWADDSNNLLKSRVREPYESLRTRLLLLVVRESEDVEAGRDKFVHALGYTFLVRRCADHVHIINDLYQDLSAVVDVDTLHEA